MALPPAVDPRKDPSGVTLGRALEMAPGTLTLLAGPLVLLVRRLRILRRARHVAIDIPAFVCHFVRFEASIHEYAVSSNIDALFHLSPVCLSREYV